MLKSSGGGCSYKVQVTTKRLLVQSYRWKGRISLWRMCKPLGSPCCDVCFQGKSSCVALAIITLLRIQQSKMWTWVSSQGLHFDSVVMDELTLEAIFSHSMFAGWLSKHTMRCNSCVRLHPIGHYFTRFCSFLQGLHCCAQGTSTFGSNADCILIL